MDEARKTIADARAAIDNKISAGFTAAEMPAIVDAIRDIDTLEAYLRKTEGAYADADPRGLTGLFLNIDDELRAAEKYHKWWETTGDATFKTLGREELKHAETLIKLAKPQAVEPRETAKLQELIIWYQALLGKLS